ncbi:uncharacterized protein LOC117177321 [Belonocnema kinseyi]|uniref:uncharacterized protein LOC117177321 n=1 Tax=Belonocnema kinseyi TaxID=2817044 RepID=UPI00143D0DE2|nr:uncharacterized protein LOC117177321 [Belonocnema kinseyi]
MSHAGPRLGKIWHLKGSQHQKVIMDNRQQYKQYLEPGSQDPISSSSWYRCKKVLKDKVAGDPSQFTIRNMENEQAMDYDFSKSDNMMEKGISHEYSQENLSTEMAF